MKFKLPEVDQAMFLKCGMLAYCIIVVCQLIGFAFKYKDMAWYNQIQALGGVFFGIVLVLFFYGMFRSLSPQIAPSDVLGEFGAALKEMGKKK
jgi:hypothetical protein